MLSIGIVGLPNVGKSTLFNALIKQKAAAAANYPFCTIEPNVGIVEVPDERLNRLADVFHPKKIVPTVIEFVDIAGLVAGASKGEGLGNQFLSHIRNVDAILQVVRIFKDENVTHVDGSVDPQRDLEVINTELILADLQTLEKRMNSVEKAAKSGDKQLQAKLNLYQRLQKALDEGKLAHSIEISEEEKPYIKELCLLTSKPFLYALNIDEPVATAGGVRESRLLGVNPDQQIPFCAKLEEDLNDLSDADRTAYLSDLGVKETGLDRLITKGYEALNLITFLTAGEPEVRAWTVRKDARAPEAAGVIHSDFQEKFIKAEAISWHLLVENGGWSGAREKGLVRIEGKEYVVQDGDTMYFRHG